MNINSFQDQPTSQRQQTTNLRTYLRNVPSAPLQPYLDARSVSTKYAVLPIIDLHAPVHTELKQCGTYNISQVFNPGNASAPWSGYSTNINVESDLRNQLYPLQECSQRDYVPGSQSSLYNVKWQNSNKPQQPFPNLFKEQTFNPVNPNMHQNNVGYALFNNSTRSQLKDVKI